MWSRNNLGMELVERRNGFRSQLEESYFLINVSFAFFLMRVPQPILEAYYYFQNTNFQKEKNSSYMIGDEMKVNLKRQTIK